MALLFTKGTAVFHPIHGAGKIKEIATKEILEEERQYYVIELPHNELHEVMVPVKNADNVGLRAINTESAVQHIFEILKSREGTDEESLVQSFYQRYREYVARVQSGIIDEVASIYKLLYVRNTLKPLGMKDKNLFEMAEHLLLSEMIFSLHISRNEALTRVTKCLETAFPPPLPPESTPVETQAKNGTTSK